VIKTKLLVAADGPFSLVREAAMLKCAMRRYRYSWANTILARNPDDVREGHVFFGRGVYLGVVPTQANELVIFHLTTSESAAQYQQQFGTIAALRQQYTQIAPILKECMHNIRSWDQVSCPPAVRVRADRWVNDGLALVGDAAVNVNPVTSQGASVALESGIRLATVVKRCFQRGDLSAHSLAPYEAWCRPEAEAVQELGDNSLRFFSSHSRVLGYIKERSLRKLESNISMKLKFMGGFCGLWWLAPDGIGWRDALAAAGFWPTSRHTVR
jgi:2-polyprenyl-6-methoxyphenol hydroxylase-like FAD-dependent oxidoreductase